MVLSNLIEPDWLTIFFLFKDYTGSLGSVYGSAMNGNDAVYEESACSQDSVYGLSFNVDSLSKCSNLIYETNNFN